MKFLSEINDLRIGRTFPQVLLGKYSTWKDKCQVRYRTLENASYTNKTLDPNYQNQVEISALKKISPVATSQLSIFLRREAIF